MIGLTPVQVVIIYDDIIGSNELQGLAPDKSIEGTIDRIENRISYGLIADVYHLASCYVSFISQAYAFNDANKRTGFAAMDTVLALNGIELVYEAEDAGGIIIKIVNGDADENDLAAWLRALPHLPAE